MGKTRLTKLDTLNQEFSFQEAFDEFIEILKNKGKSETTIKDYTYFIKRFNREYPFFPDYMMLKKSASDWLLVKINPASYNLRLTYNKAFFRFCVEKGYMTENPMQDFTVKKTEAKIVQNNPEQLIELLKQPDLKTYVGLRDYAMLILTLDTGIRPSEIRQIIPADFDEKNSMITVPAEVSKTRVSRILPLQTATVSVIRKLLSYRPSEWINAPIFATNEGNMMLARAWQDRVALYSQKVGKKITPYDLRHDFALLYLKNGGNIFTLQRMMGHKTLEMTKRYIYIDTDELKRMASIASPLNTLVNSRKRVGKI